MEFGEKIRHRSRKLKDLMDDPNPEVKICEKETLEVGEADRREKAS